MRSKILLFALCIAFGFLGSFASADVLFSQPNAVYNVGDNLEISATIRATSYTDSFLELDLACGNESRMIYFSPYLLNAGQEEKIERKLALSKSFLQNNAGTCIIIGKYNGMIYSSQAFRVSSAISIAVNSEKTSFDPGEAIQVKGTAIKENGKNSEGFIEANIDGVINSSVKSADSVKDGKFEFNISIAENAKSGNYILKLSAYEKFNEEVTNSGEKEMMVSVSQKPKKMEIILDNVRIIPGSSLKFRPVVYDQAEDLVDADAGIVIYDNNGEIFFVKNMRTGEEAETGFSENTSYGNWRIEASSLGFSDAKEFEIEQLEKARFSIFNNTLVILNIGNVPYKKPVTIKIGDKPLVIGPVDIGVGEQKIYVLTGDDEGMYAISVSDGAESLEASAPLLGGVVGVREMKAGWGVMNSHPIVWVFLILIFGLSVFAVSRRVIKKRFYEYAPKEDKRYEQVGKKISEIPAASEFHLREIKNAEQSLVIDGEKQEAGIIVVKVKNAHEIENNKFARDAVESAVSRISSGKGVISRSFDAYTGIFAPKITKSFKNDIAAVKTASEIAASLNEHNSRYKDKIDYGIGISSGEIAVKIENGKLKYTALGNSMNSARKAAEMANKAVLLTQSANKKVMNEVKTQKHGDYFSISRIVERESHKDFLAGFKERNKF